MQQLPALVDQTFSSTNIGKSVALSGDGNVALVGSIPKTGNVGSAVVFTRSKGVWSAAANLLGAGASQAIYQWNSVALSADGTTALVGGPSDNNPTFTLGAGVGAAWVFTESNGVWSQQGPKLIGTGAAGNANQGQSVALSANGNTAVVAGYENNQAEAVAWVFTRNAGGWTQQGPKLVLSGEKGLVTQTSLGNLASVSISADGTTFALAETFQSFGGGIGIFTLSNGAWTRQGPLLVGAGGDGLASQGTSVAIASDGNTLVAGGPNDSHGRGSIWFFTRTAGVWAQQGPLLGAPLTNQSGVNVGLSVAISGDGNTVLAGAPFVNGSGGCFVYRRVNGVWSIQANPLLGPNNPGSYRGVSVALSADGLTALFGSFDNPVGGAWAYAVPNLPSELDLVMGSGQSTPGGALFPTPLSVKALDTGGLPVPGVPVSFSVTPVTGAGATFQDFGAGSVAIVKTDNNGIASATPVANSVTGSYLVQATFAQGVTGSGGVRFNLTNTLAAPIPSIVFAPIPTHIYGDKPFSLMATSTSPASIEFSVLSGPAIIFGNALTITGVGPVTVQATQVATSQFSAGSAAQTFNVAKANPAISWQPPIDMTVGQTLGSAQLNVSVSIPGTLSFDPAPGQSPPVGDQTIKATFLPADNRLYNQVVAIATVHVFSGPVSIAVIRNGGLNSVVLAPDSFGSLFGTDLADKTVVATTLPYPNSAGGITLALTDAAGVTVPLPLFYVSSRQINFLIPAGIAVGSASLSATNGAASVTTIPVTIGVTSPGLLSADGSGQGLALGQTIRSGGQIYLTLYGTGFRNASKVTVTVAGVSAQILFAGAQGQFPGLDQLNASIPDTNLTGDLTIAMTADGVQANSVLAPVQ